MKHYSKEELAMFCDGEPGAWNRLLCKAHLKKCAECRRLLESLEKDDLFLKELKNSIRIFNELADLRVKNKR